MKHEFTSNDLGRALDQVTYDAGKIQGVSYVTLRQFLDALPDVPHWGDCAVDRAKAGVYEQLLDHPYFDGWSEADESVEDYMIGRLNEAHAAEQHDPQIPVADVRKGDRVRVLTTIGNYYEFTITDIDTQLGMLIWNGGNVYKRSAKRVWLINRPVTHPDPAEHPVILVRTCWDSGILDDRHFTPAVVAIWDGFGYKSHEYGFNAQDISSWSPAKVVADDE